MIFDSDYETIVHKERGKALQNRGKGRPKTIQKPSQVAAAAFIIAALSLDCYDH